MVTLRDDHATRPSRHGDGLPGAAVVSRRAVLAQAGRMSQRAIGVTQQRNAKAARSRRRQTLRRLHEIGVFLKDAIICQPRRL